MNREVFLSIIIPVFNAEKYLPQGIEGIIAANVEDMELLLIDDGSTDQSYKISCSYQSKYPFVKCLRQENSGPSAARNLGLRLAQGKYIAFMDADDYIDPLAFARHINLLRQTEAEIWVSDFHRVADNGCVLDKVYQITDTELPITDRDYVLEFLSAKDCVWNVWRYIFRRGFLAENELLFSEGFNIAEDLEFVVRALSLCNNFSFLHKPYYFYRVNYGATLTRKYTAQRVEQLMTMLSSAATAAGQGELADLIRAKLAREYILNLSLYCELARNERAAALKAFESAQSLTDNAVGVYRAAAKTMQVLRMKNIASLLYVLKKVKRCIRSIKTKCKGNS